MSFDLIQLLKASVTKPKNNNNQGQKNLKDKGVSKG